MNIEFVGFGQIIESFCCIVEGFQAFV
uniref:Uncharacterized protein n=1 Tax=Rhizophora mucronata TaxID=61149 RepID=A0A2P2Q1R8_RHIMU